MNDRDYKQSIERTLRIQMEAIMVLSKRIKELEKHVKPTESEEGER